MFPIPPTGRQDFYAVLSERPPCEICGRLP